MEEEYDTFDTLADESLENSSDGEEAVDSAADKAEAVADALSLEELNSHLGKNFKDKDTALKALKDTFKYVGKAGQLEKELAKVKESSEKPQGDYVTREQYDTDMFYKENPDYNELRDTIDRIAKADGITPKEVVEQDSFKALYEKVKGYEDSQKVKSVLESNPRIGQATSKISQSRQAAKEGNYDVASKSAIEAVMETFASEE